MPIETFEALKRHKQKPENRGIPTTPRQCKGVILESTGDDREKLKSVKDVIQENRTLGTKGKICFLASAAKKAMDRTVRS